MAIWNLFVSCFPVLQSFPFILHGLSQLSLYFPHFVSKISSCFPVLCIVHFAYMVSLFSPAFLYGKARVKYPEIIQKREQ
jgi:hypothetical protein